VTFFERLRSASRARRTYLCVGLDPDPERIPDGAAGAVRHCLQVIDQTKDYAACYKPNAAFWAQYGTAGWTGLTEVRLNVPQDIPFLLDLKVADIGSTMAAYARTAFEALDADAVTVHAYHGADSLEAYTSYADRGIYVVCRTSNPGAKDLQDIDAGGEPFYLRVAELARRVNQHGNVGLVVGTSVPQQVAEVRAQVRELPFLLPGIGAQGGDLEASVRSAWNGDPASVLVNASRAILYADEPGKAARELRDSINAVVAGIPA
jgi:orotidine 5'-phosphate decarboxylase subfamily 2